MSDIDTGGPAFPTDLLDNYGHVGGYSHGMTLRDYFAAQAMQGAISGRHPITHLQDAHELIAVAAYAIADAMLKVRKG